MLLPVVVIGLIVVGTLETIRVAAIPEGALTLERDPDVEHGMLTGELARAGATILRRFGARTAAYVVDGCLRLPVTDGATSPCAVRPEMGTWIRRWYNEDVANVDYRNLGPAGIDATLEVGISEYQFRVECLRDLGLLTLKSEGVSDTLIQAMMGAPSATGSGGMPAPETKSPGAAGQETQDAIALYRQGKIVEAEAAFDTRLAARPGDVDLTIWKALAVPDLPAALRAEALDKLGKVAADRDKKPDVAREYWERAVAADPACRYGIMA